MLNLDLLSQTFFVLFKPDLKVLALLEVGHCHHVPLVVVNGVELYQSLIWSVHVHNLILANLKTRFDWRQFLDVHTLALHGQMACE